MALMIHSGEEGIDTLAVTAVPCGHCRQFLKEYKHADSIKVEVASRQLSSDWASLLPANFGPSDLGM